MKSLSTRIGLALVLPMGLIAVLLWVAIVNLTAYQQVELVVRNNALVQAQLGTSPPGSSVSIPELAPFSRWILGVKPPDHILVQIEGRAPASIRAGLPADFVRSLRLQIGLITFLVFGLTLAALLVSVAVVRLDLVRALRQLRTWLAHIETDARKDDLVLWQQAPAPGQERSDEIGELARGYAALMQTLQARSNELQDAEERAGLGEFAAGIAHELGNPLSGALQTVYVCEEEGLAEGELREYVAELGQALLRMDGIVQGLQALYKGEEIALEPVPMAEVYRSVATRVGASGIRMPVDSKLVVAGNRFMLEQALFNVVRNAAEAARLCNRRLLDDAWVQVEEQQADNVCLIRVRNEADGVLVADDGLPLHNRAKGGMGLGLRLTVRSLQRMQASIHFYKHGSQIEAQLTCRAAGST